MRKIIFRNHVAVVALSHINGCILPDLLLEEVLNANLMIIALFPLVFISDKFFSCCCLRNSTNYVVFSSRILCDYVAPIFNEGKCSSGSIGFTRSTPFFTIYINKNIFFTRNNVTQFMVEFSSVHCNLKKPKPSKYISLYTSEHVFFM